MSLLHWFIINPQSGNGRGQLAWESIKELIDSNKICYEKFIINGELTSKLIEYDKLPPDRIWIVGGDGTIHQVINMLFSLFSASYKALPPLSIIPAGSGNDLARALDISLSPAKAFKQSIDGQIVDLDLLELTTQASNKVKYGLTVGSVGFDSEVAARFSASFLKPILNNLNLSRLAYIITIIHTLISYKSQTIQLVIDDNEYTFDKVWLSAVANLPYYGCGLPIAPKATGTDNKLDICIIHSCSKWLFPIIFYSIIKGSHTNLNNVSIFKGTKVHIKPKQSSLAQADGEVLGQVPLTVQVLPQAIQLIY
ncbi:diacylglycerol/lipid kinase family protein [Desulfuribacillus alkaliarsenatis]|uniref:DAGKc domain-containing protein n=1 Tax=Desulfuribacillus alkaliarsenatis TaxID=766136 RepID=A0A1E5G664_9FIRM|nr:diacylglycerol kinase family protein [Desulfuribacillus alkaliarsenatis]OEF98585.1 hypothetical protein BHF68_02675 [Desulfuribacillus alkaliarsenatis]